MKFPLLCFIILLFSQCNGKKEITQEKTADIPSIPVAFEKKVLLDSTVVGVHTLISGLDVPWEITWGPDNWIWFTEQGGRVSKVNPVNGERVILLEIPQVFRKRTTGLLGMALHPDTEKFPYVFLDYTVQKEDTIISRLVRYSYRKDTLADPLVLLEVPGSTGHNGSRVTMAPDGKVIWATGDAMAGDNAQNVHTLNGKILRLNIDGTIPKDNPFPNSPVWAWGFRNHQGLTYGKNEILYTSEHGDATDDEINLIKKGHNYGWPEVRGYTDLRAEKGHGKDSLITTPLKAWTPTIAPAGIGYYHSAKIPEWEHTLILTTLKHNDVRVLKLTPSGDAIVSERIYFDQKFGRLRDVCISPDGDVYISTTNRDWNPGEGYPKAGDDRIIRVFKLRESQGIKDRAETLRVRTTPQPAGPPGLHLYTQYCASCHKADGAGVEAVFPPLKGAPRVTGSKEALIKVVLEGLSGTEPVDGVAYGQPMPAFSFLDDKKISGVLTYIRTSFGNHSGKVTSEQVRMVRNKLKEQEGG